MPKKTIIKYAFIHAMGAAAYIALIATFMSNAAKIFGPDNSADNKIFPTTVFLMTFVISAAIMGLLIFGRPVLLYMDGLKKEAVSLTFYTIGFLVLIAIAIILILLFLKQ